MKQIFCFYLTLFVSILSQSQLPSAFKRKNLFFLFADEKKFYNTQIWAAFFGNFTPATIFIPKNNAEARLITEIPRVCLVNEDCKNFIFIDKYGSNCVLTNAQWSAAIPICLSQKRFVP